MKENLFEKYILKPVSKIIKKIIYLKKVTIKINFKIFFIKLK